MAEADFLAVDWGTTNRRVYAIDAGGAVGPGDVRRRADEFVAACQP